MISRIQLLLQRIPTLLASKTGRLIIINTAGTYLNVAFALIFVLLMTRTLERVEYGAMTVLLNISYILANIMEFGTTATIYSQIPALHQTKETYHDLLSFIKTTLSYQTILSLIVVLLLIVAFPTLDARFFKTNSHISILVVTAFSVLCFVWQNTIMNMFFAVKKFAEANIWLNVSNVVKTGIILLMLPFGFVNTGSVIFVFGIVGPAIFVAISSWRYRKNIKTMLLVSKISRSHIKIEYTLTNFIAQQFFNLGMRMDLFILSFYGLRVQVADYGLSQKIILTIISTVVSITQVLSPRYAVLKDKLQAKSELKHSLLYLTLPTLCFALLLIVPESLFTLVFTDKFVETPLFTRLLGAVFIIFSLGQVFALFHLYTFKKPHILLWTNIVFFIIMTIGCLTLIPIWGAVAAPIVLAFALTITVGLQGGYFVREYKRMGARHVEAQG